MQTAERHMVYHQREGSYERRTGAHLRRITDGHCGVCQHNAYATTGLERGAIGAAGGAALGAMAGGSPALGAAIGGAAGAATGALIK